MDHDPALIDITRPLVPGFPVWPGDAPCRLAWTTRLEDGAAANVSELSMTAHCGTHVDAPLHVLADGQAIGTVPLSSLVGTALVVEATGREWIEEALVEGAFRDHGPAARILFRTGCWGDPAVFPERFPALTAAAACRIREAGLVLVGTDAPSVDPFWSEDLPAHRILAESGIVIVENLLLDGVVVGRYELIALPLRLAHADASPVRAVLREL